MKFQKILKDRVIKKKRQQSKLVVIAELFFNTMELKHSFIYKATLIKSFGEFETKVFLCVIQKHYS